MARLSCVVLWAVGAVCLSFCGCSEEPPSFPHEHNPAFEVTLCGKCGDIKADGHACKTGARVCGNCGMHKGSILCCSGAINGRRDAILCAKCGEVAFSRKCCLRLAGKDDLPTCTKCGLHKDSPGCCKIERVVMGPNGEAIKANDAG
jgi:hypothetical protein